MTRKQATSKKKTTTTPKDTAINIVWVCGSCGIAANVLTCLKKYGSAPNVLCNRMATFHKGKCDVCKEKVFVTETRDFFHPDFNLLLKVMRKWTEKNEKL